MAKLDRPLFGDWATGTLARVLSFRHVANPEEPPGDPVIYLGEVAALPRSHCPPAPAQIAQRLLYASAVAAWRALSDEERAAWNTAKPTNLCGFNFFIKLFLLPLLAYFGYCVFGIAWFQVSSSPNQPAAVDYDALFPASIDEFPTMVDGAHSPQAWLWNRAAASMVSIQTYLIDHQSSIEEA